jgi:hypothetical protein
MATLKYRDEEIEVGYTTYGRYIPATHDNPPEYPDHFVETVYYKDVDIFPILSYEDKDEINELLIDYLYN